MSQDSNENSPFNPERSIHRKQRPNFPASYTVHISPTQKEIGTAMWSAPSYWITQGYELIALIGILYGFDITRIEFSNPEFARDRYDVALVLPREEGEKAMTERICLALQRELGVVVSKEVTRRDVYVVTAPHGPGLALHKADGLGGSSATSSYITVPEGSLPPSLEDVERLLSPNAKGGTISVDSISISNGTIAHFCSTLEKSLDRPVVDESQLPGNYDIQLTRGEMSKGQFFAHIRVELGLQILSGIRDVQRLTVRPE
jgi:uncharacterized protein (TIGR03435 family)